MVVVMTGKNAVFPHESFDILEKGIVPALRKRSVKPLKPSAAMSRDEIKRKDNEN